MERTDVSGDTDTADTAKAAEQAVKTGNAEDSGLAAAKRAYDASCKRLLADRSVLARILKGSLQEYLDFDVSVIAEFCIEREAQIGSVPVLPDSGKADLNGNFGTSRSPKERTQNESAQPEDRALARGIAEGMELGRQEGIDIGEERKSVDIARNLIMANMDESDIAEWTGLSPERIRKLKK